MTTPFVCKVHANNSENASTPTQTTNHSKCYDLLGQRRTNSLFQMTSIILIFLNLPYLVYGIYLQPDFKEKSCWTGERFFVTCLREKGESEGEVIWIDVHGREISENSGAVRMYTANSDAGGTSLMFEDVKKKDAGQYVCQYKRDGQTPKQISFKLNVYKAINFQGNREEVVAVQGDQPFTLTCIARFDPSATFSQITWFYNNAPLAVNEEGGQFTESNHQSANLEQVTIKSTLTIRGVRKENEGNYTCRAFTSNVHLSKMEQFRVHLRVQFPPNFTPNMPTEIWIDLEKRKDDMVQIASSVQADPPARFQWYSFDGIPIGDGRFRNQVVNITENTDNMSILTVRYHHPAHKNENQRSRMNMNQITKFRCKAQNNFGEREASFEIKTGSMPVSPTVYDHKYGKGLLTLVLLEPEIEPPIDLYRVEIENKLYVDFNATNENPGNNNTYTIPIDIPRGEHMMTVYAHNPVGWSSNIPGLQPQKLAVVSASTHLQSYLAVIFALMAGLAVFYN